MTFQLNYSNSNDSETADFIRFSNLWTFSPYLFSYFTFFRLNFNLKKMTTDITNRADVELLVRTFYAKLLEDPFMSPHFEGVDFEHHFPRMIQFWAFILLDEPGNTGNVFDKHRHLKVDERHFERWINTFSATVDALFEGKTAEKAKQNAQVIGYTFQSKMKFLNP